MIKYKGARFNKSKSRKRSFKRNEAKFEFFGETGKGQFY